MPGRSLTRLQSIALPGLTVQHFQALERTGFEIDAPKRDPIDMFVLVASISTFISHSKLSQASRVLTIVVDVLDRHRAPEAEFSGALEGKTTDV